MVLPPRVCRGEKNSTDPGFARSHLDTPEGASSGVQSQRRDVWGGEGLDKAPGWCRGLPMFAYEGAIFIFCRVRSKSFEVRSSARTFESSSFIHFVHNIFDLCFMNFGFTCISKALNQFKASLTHHSFYTLLIPY